MNEAEKEAALAAFERRRDLYAAVKRTNNADRPVGSTMIFHCRPCGVQCDEKPEGFNSQVDRVKVYCDDCEELLREGLLDIVGA